MKYLAPLVLVLLLGGSVQADQDRYDSLMNEWTQTDEPETQLEILLELSHNLSNTESALRYCYQALDLAEHLKNEAGMFNALHRMGVIKAEQGAHASGVADLFRALEIANKLEDKKKIAEALYGLGYLYDYHQDFDQAIKYHKDALRISEEIGDKNLNCMVYTSMGSVYQQSGNTVQALEYVTKALDLARALNYSEYVRKNLDNLGSIHLNMNELSMALDYFMQATEISHSAMAKTWLQNNIGKVYSKMEEYDKAAQHAMISLTTAQDIGSKPRIEAACLNLTEIYEKQGDHRAALIYYKMLTDVRADLSNEQMARQLANLELEHERAEEQEAKQERNYIQYFFIFLAIIGFLLITYLTFRLWFHVEHMQRYVNLLAFASLLLTFEFLLVIIDPLADEWTGGVPIEKLGINMTLALGLAVVHTFVRRKYRIG
jgi:tetratricopeptide (TPR) repeat protein